MDKFRNKKALVIHDDLNICGGSERLAAITIDLLSEIGFGVDLATFKNPNVRKIRKLLGLDLSDCIRMCLLQISTRF